MSTLESQRGVTIEFIGGGPLDGQFTFPGDAGALPLAEDERLAWGFYHLTGGEVGRAAMGISPAALELLMTRGGDAAEHCGAKPHRYRVIERREVDGTTFVRAKAFEASEAQSAQ